MSGSFNNANIERVSFEEIQEFKDLDLAYLPVPGSDIMILLAYDVNTGKFTTAEYNPATGGINLTSQSSLGYDIQVNTDKLSVAEDYVFKKGLSLTDVLYQLCNPSLNSDIKLYLTNTLITSQQGNGDEILIEVGVDTPVGLDYDFNQNQGGTLDIATIEYYKEGSVGPISGSEVDILLTNPSSVELSVTALTNAGGIFDATRVRNVTSVRAVSPFFFGGSASVSPPSTLVGNTPNLVYTDDEKSIVLDFQGFGSSPTYYWFAVSPSYTPVNWVGIYSNGQLQTSNEGLVNELFSQKTSVTYRGNPYDVYKLTTPTIFKQNIKIYFS